MDGFQDLFEETDAVLKASAVLVPAAVGQGRQKLMRQISVRGVYLKGVEARAGFVLPCFQYAAAPKATLNWDRID